LTLSACLVRHRWRYKQTVMANLYPGFGNFYSLVPPFLRTGNNFGCTAFVASLYRLISSGRLPKSVTTGFRQTDGGSDADGKTSHGLHYVLVREGTFDRLLWGRLRTGHSHDWCDFTFSAAKNIFYPREGVGPGCASPMEYHAALTDGLKKLPGGLEVMWQLANFDFDKFVDSFMDRDEFTQMSSERLWCYEYDPSLRDLYVKCTFKSKLNDKATAEKAEWKPHMPPNESGKPLTPRVCACCRRHTTQATVRTELLTSVLCHRALQVGKRQTRRASSL
jgi:hypothetical protein